MSRWVSCYLRHTLSASSAPTRLLGHLVRILLAGLEHAALICWSQARPSAGCVGLNHQSKHWTGGNSRASCLRAPSGHPTLKTSPVQIESILASFWLLISPFGIAQPGSEESSWLSTGRLPLKITLVRIESGTSTSQCVSLRWSLRKYRSSSSGLHKSTG